MSDIVGSHATGRFVYLVEDKFSYHLESDDLTVVVGTVHGTVRVHDEVYIIDHTGKTLLTQIKQLESMSEKGTEHPDSCTDAPIALLLGVSPSEIDKFCVVTSIKPWVNKDVNQAVENPYLLGMLYGERFRNDDLYFGKFVYALAHSFFLSPVSMSKKPESNGDGTATFTSQTQLSFSTLSNDRYPGKTTLAVFTDWLELGKWKDAPKDENGKVQTIILRFPDIVALAADPGINGCVINAFGELSLFVPTELIDHITGLEGYRKEYGDSPKTDN
ncbi:MAG: SseB family protein [Saccharofermentans sp.]|nr:SseB family protein [Saccharofermentans sp.]